MDAKTRRFFWLAPLGMIAGIAGSLVVVWLVSRAMGFSFNPSLVAAFSAILSATIIAAELRKERQG